MNATKKIEIHVWKGRNIVGKGDASNEHFLFLFITMLLTLYHTILTFSDPEDRDF